MQDDNDNNWIERDHNAVNPQNQQNRSMQNTGWNTVSYGMPEQPPREPDAQQTYHWNYEEYSRAGGTSPKPQRAKKKRRKFIVAGTAIASVLAVLVIGFASYGVYRAFFTDRGTEPYSSSISSSDKKTQELNITDRPADSTASESSTGKMTTEQVSKKVRPSVVGVVTYQSLASNDGSTQGSGIIMSADGYIITNAHVVDSDASLIKVILYNDDEYEAKIVGMDTRSDLAVLKVDASNLSYATFGNSDQLEVGESVLAIGNPGGMELAGSVTMGIVSAVNRSVVSELGYTLNTIQTDAAINPGNSGGALVNLYGQVIGINSLKISATEYEGIGFAIPINDAKPIIDELIQYGRIPNRVKLGVSLQEIGEVAAKAYNVPNGLLIVRISSDSNLAAKGVVAGDIITAVNGSTTDTVSGLMKILDSHKPGDTVTISIYRRDQSGQGRSMDVTITLQEDKG